jgi:hypothetical protein
MKNNNIFLRIEFEGEPIIKDNFHGLEEADRAWAEVRRKLR